MAYGRFINDTYWLLMPWKWLDDGVNLTYEGERQVDGRTYDVVLLTFDTGVGLTSGDRYWGFVSRETGLMDRWEYVLQKEDGSPGDGAPTAWTWGGWRDAGGGVRLATRKERIGGEKPLAIVSPAVSLAAEAPEAVFHPILRPPAAAPPAEPAGTPPSRAGVSQLLVVLNKSDHTASLVEVGGFEVLRSVPTGVGPHEGAVSRDGRTLYVSNYGGSAPGNTLSVIDLPAGVVKKVVDLGEHTRPHGVAVGPDGSIWVTAEGSKSVLRLSASDYSIRKVYATGQEVTHMIVLSPDGKRAFTANIGSGGVSAIDVESGTVTSVPTGAGAEGIDVSPDGREVWVAHRDEDQVTVLDAATLMPKGRIPTCRFPIRVKITPDGGRALVSCNRSNELLVLDRVLRQELGRVALEPGPIGIQVAPGGEIAVVASTQADRISLVDVEEMDLLGSFEAGREPDGLAWATWVPPPNGRERPATP
jgi:DNA-binding beta-propeller fold protein YncE